MSRMSDLDLMVREGERTAEDFIGRGFDARTARAMAEVVEALEPKPEPDGTYHKPSDRTGRGFRNGVDDGEGDHAYGHGPGCFGECDGLYDCGA